MLLFLIFFSLVVYSQYPEKILTLQDCIELTLKNNQELLLIEENKKIQHQRLIETMSLFYPKIGFNASIFQYKTDNIFGPLPDVPFLIFDKSNTSKKNVYTYSSYIGYDFFTGGKSRSAYQLAYENYQHSSNDYEILKNILIAETKLKFYELIYLNQKHKNYLEFLDFLNSLKDNLPDDLITREEFSDILFNTKAELNEINFQIEQKRLELLDIIKLELDTNFVLEGKIEIKRLDKDLPTLFAWAQQYRYELKQTAIQEKIDELGVKLSQAERYPKFTLSAAFEKRSENEDFKNKNWFTGLSLNLPLFDGFAGISRVKQKKSQLEQSRIRKAQIYDRVSYEVRKAFKEYNYYLQNYDTIQQHLKEKNQQLLEIEERWKNKKINFSQYLKFKNHLFELNNKLFKTEYLVLNTYIQLEKSVGKSLE